MRLSLASGTLAWNPIAHGSDARVDATIVPDEIRGLHSKGERRCRGQRQRLDRVPASLVVVKNLQKTSATPTTKTLSESFGIPKHFLPLFIVHKPPT